MIFKVPPDPGRYVHRARARARNAKHYRRWPLTDFGTVLAFAVIVLGAFAIVIALYHS